ncbi:MAG: hypothetical protein ACKO23_12750 [Gemmataceae bacterium]
MGRQLSPGSWSGTAWLSLTLFLSQAPVIAAPPQVTHLFPPGGQRGTKIEVVLHGTFTWPVRVWAPGITVTVKKESGKLEVDIPADLPADRVWFRFFNDEGASAPHPFLIGNLKEFAEKEPNNTIKTAQVCPGSAVTVNGALTAGDVDCYSVPLKAGQTLVAALDANTRLGSPIDAILQIVSSRGVVLGDNHDDLGLDPRLAYRAEQDGNYVVRLFAFPSTPGTDIRFGGAANAVYRLTLTTGPYITHAIPRSVFLDRPGKVEVRGWNIPPRTEAPVRSYLDARPEGFQECEPLGDIRAPAGTRAGLAFLRDHAGFAPLRLQPITSNLVHADASRPMDLPTLPVSITGCLMKPGREDEYRLPLKKGQHILLILESSSMDYLLDPVLGLADPDGKQVAEVDDTGESRDVVLEHTASRDGIYRIQVSDRYRQGGDRHGYLLTVRPVEPDFELALAADSLVVTPGKPVDLTVKVKRRTGSGKTPGSIRIELMGLPSGVTAPAVVSEPSGPTSASVTLKITSTGPGFSGPIRVVGRAKDPTPIERTARTPAQLGICFDYLWLTTRPK